VCLQLCVAISHSLFFSHISTELSHEYGLESTIDVFFKDLFPLAYHHAVESHVMAELNVDYKNCLRNSYENLKPFGDIPQITSRILTQYIGSSNIFLRALDEGGKIVAEIENFSSENLSESCRKALFKMDHCGMCKGYADSKPCHSYCSNVLR
jgi:dally